MNWVFYMYLKEDDIKPYIELNITGDEVYNYISEIYKNIKNKKSKIKVSHYPEDVAMFERFIIEDYTTGFYTMIINKNIASPFEIK